MRSYLDLIKHTFDFPTPEFDYHDYNLHFHGLNLMDIIAQYGTPLKISYLPKITQSILFAKEIFAEAIKKNEYQGQYIYCYCTKASHFKFVLEEVLKNDVQLETSSAYDIGIIRKLNAEGLIDRKKLIICNGYKPKRYQQAIVDLINEGFKNCIPVLDSLDEVDYYKQHIKRNFKVGIRVASDEEPNFGIYTSRLGVRYNDVNRIYFDKIADEPQMELKLLHFFINSGINDTTYYWTELNKFIYKYCELKKACETLDTIDIGGGFPIKHSLGFSYDHRYMANMIVQNIKAVCEDNEVPVPHIITEFGSYTVGESGAVLYSVIEQKRQNDKELWYMIDGSLITHLPDIWGKDQKFIMLAINNVDYDFTHINLGGITCDSDDYYNLEKSNRYVYLPKIPKGKKQYIGFFHTGAYQESLGGYGGIQHCLIPAPKHLIISRDETGQVHIRIFRPEQPEDEMLAILGY